jgi:thioesterase domain-containing protein
VNASGSVAVADAARPLDLAAQAASSLERWESIVAAAWRTALRAKRIDPDADFRDLGMNANRAMRVVAEIWLATSRELPINVFFDAPSVRRMAAAIDDGSAFLAPELVVLRAGDPGAPLFVFPGGPGALAELTDLVRALDHPGVIYGLAFSGLDGVGPIYESLEAEAARAAGIIRRAQPVGPCRLLGYSIGGITALETARRLRQDGEPAFLGLIDTALNDHLWPYDAWLGVLARKYAGGLRTLARRLRSGARPADETNIGPRRRGSQITFRFRNPRSPNYPYHSPYWSSRHTPNYSRVAENTCRMKGLYAPTPYDGKLCFFASAGGEKLACDPRRVWPQRLPNAEWVRVPGNHLSVLVGRNAASLAAEISTRLRAAA